MYCKLSIVNETYIKWGIIGLGNIAYHFAKSFYNLDNAKLVAVASNLRKNY